MYHLISTFLIFFLCLQQSFAANAPELKMKKPRPRLYKVTFIRTNHAENFLKVFSPMLPYCKLTQYKAPSNDCKEKKDEIDQQINAIVKNEKTSIVVGFGGEQCVLNSFDYYDCAISNERMVESYKICESEKDEEACKTFLMSDETQMPTQLERDLYKLRGYKVLIEFCHHNADSLCKLLTLAVDDDKDFKQYSRNKKYLLQKYELLKLKKKSLILKTDIIY